MTPTSHHCYSTPLPHGRYEWIPCIHRCPTRWRPWPCFNSVPVPEGHTLHECDLHILNCFIFQGFPQWLNFHNLVIHCNYSYTLLVHPTVPVRCVVAWLTLMANIKDGFNPRRLQGLDNSWYESLTDCNSRHLTHNLHLSRSIYQRHCIAAALVWLSTLDLVINCLSFTVSMQLHQYLDFTFQGRFAKPHFRCLNKSMFPCDVTTHCEFNFAFCRLLPFDFWLILLFLQQHFCFWF